jgi:D-serine deaminase-like pyridoxal phosphate-dependent protein
MKITESPYKITNAPQLESPALVFYEDIIRANTDLAIKNAGGAHRLWVHVKTHKTSDIIRLQMKMGISRFKCATIAEAEMLAECGAKDIILAYPLVGPNISRFLALCEKYNNSRFYAIGDDFEQLTQLEKQSSELGIVTQLLIDVNLGMNRTGVPLDKLEKFCRRLATLGKGISVQGFHCYDGHNKDSEHSVRDESAKQSYNRIMAIRSNLQTENIPLEILVFGGTPSFPCYAQYPDIFLSPGTLFIHDYGSAKNFSDLEYIPGGAVMSRVVSHPADGIFTLDVGSKAIAADPLGVRGIVAGYDDDIEPLFQSEEHWVFRMKNDNTRPIPPIGTVVYIIPTHICPTSALYPEILIVRAGNVADSWKVTARNRRISV